MALSPALQWGQTALLTSSLLLSVYFISKVKCCGVVLCGKLKRRVPGADRIAQQVKARAAKPRDPSSVPWTNAGEEKT